MTKGNWRRSRKMNDSYKSRHRRKSSKGAGVYAIQAPGTGPNGIHVRAMPGDKDFKCRCGGCSAKDA